MRSARCCLAPARGLVDQIGVRLETLSPQLGRLDGREEEAYEVRRLIGEQLPAFVTDYARVPEPLRRVERNGRTPDAELVAGLKLIEQEIADMTARLAQKRPRQPVDARPLSGDQISRRGWRSTMIGGIKPVTVATCLLGPTGPCPNPWLMTPSTH